MQYPIDHIAIVVPSIADALPFYELVGGGRGSPPERLESDGVQVVFIGEGAARLELIEPTKPDSSIARFLKRRGPGLHHIAYRVPDLAAALGTLASRGVELIDDAPRAGAHGRRVAFLHPRAGQGVLIELVEG